ncbi:MAG: hypothetical protein K0U45_00065 [Alphaproteobacteria bacterium]|nr:hypothetical protein [Alphaproteobacteria bacterium]
MQKPNFLSKPNLQKVTKSLVDAGGEWRVVGGAVRNYLLGRKVSDIDLVCTLSDTQIIDALSKNNIKYLQIGRAFGVIQAVFSSEEYYEIACLRRDVETDGRHAKIEPANNFAEDSKRRDFTINALYMDDEGNISDYHNGRADIDKRLLRFVGVPAKRIEEDYLRILRLFRFQAELPEFTTDSEARDACYQHGQGLCKISGERLCQELRRWLPAPYAYDALQNARPIFKFLPEPLPKITQNIAIVPKIQALLKGVVLNDDQLSHDQLSHDRRFLLIVASLYHGVAGVNAAQLQRVLRLSRQAEKTLNYLLTREGFYHEADAIAMLYEQLDMSGKDLSLAHLLLHQISDDRLSTEKFAELRAIIEAWQSSDFPLKAKILLREGVAKNKEMGIILNGTRKWWARGGCVATDEQCLAYAKNIRDKLKTQKR